MLATENQPLVSVLMTVYNREKYISQAIESVLASTYKNFELIIVDDQSKDSSVAIAKGYANQDKRVQVHINKKNLGDYPNRNQAAAYAKGKYLKYVDADDMIYPYGLEQLVYYMEQFPNAGYGLCTMVPDKSRAYPYELTPSEAFEKNYFEGELVFNKAPLSAIINRSVFEKVGGFTGKRMLGDFEMWNLLSLNHSVVLMPQGIIWYRNHDEQEMSFYRTDPMHAFNYLVLAKDILSSSKCPLTETQKKEVLKLNMTKQSGAVLSAFKHHGWRKGNELRKFSTMSWFDIIKHKLFT